jgi:uncharacterized protein (DUF433 family)
MPDATIDLIGELLKTLKVKGTAEVLHKPGAVRLDAYPLLVYAPSQHGPGVRTEDKGVEVSAIVDDLALGLGVDAVAAKHGTTEAHVEDAVKYAVATGYAAAGGEA